MYFKQFLNERCGCASYLIASRQSHEAAIVDPALDIAPYEELLRERDFHLRYVIDTHVHADHVSGARRLVARNGGELCLHASARVTYPFRPLKDREELPLGPLRLRVMHTPGHRPELISILVVNPPRSPEPSMVLTGDSLLVGDVGRPDFGGGDAAAQWESVTRLLRLPDWVAVFPGHFEGPCGRGMCGRPSTTIGFERLFNPVARLDPEPFIAALTKGQPARPLNMLAIEATNRGVAEMSWAMLTSAPPVPEVPVADLETRPPGTLLLDVREPEEYAHGHIPGAVNLPQAELASRLEELPRDRPVWVVCQAGMRSLRAAQFLKQMGFEQVASVRGGTGEWEAAGRPLHRSAAGAEKPRVRETEWTHAGAGLETGPEERALERRIVTSLPENSETPLEELRSWVTPNRLFFVRNHFAEPEIDRNSWRLEVRGRVRRPHTWTWAELMALPERTVFATMECAGNGRSFLRRETDGVQWGAGAVGHAEWSGVPLAAVLERAEPLADAMELLCEGADMGTEPDHPEPLAFARGLPLAKAMHPDTLLAFRMNGEPLSRSHGAPVRLIVPGWYGVCSVKWIARLELLDRPFDGYFQTRKYTMRRRDDEGERVAPITRMAVKSTIIRPRADAELQPGVNRIAGLAWAGEEPVAEVTVSTDGGKMWERADLVGPQAPFSWTLWEYLWRVEQPGTYDLRSRARSASGERQPLEHDPLRGGYLVNFVHPQAVRVAAAGRAEEAGGDTESLVAAMQTEAEELSRRRLDVEMACDWWCNFCNYRTADQAAYLTHSCVDELKKQAGAGSAR